MVNTLKNIQALRGIAVLLVLALHVFATERKYSEDQVLPAWLQVGAAGVDVFFVISGFIMVMVTRDWPRGWPAARRFLWLRSSRIYPLYWLVTAAVLAIAQLFPGIATSLASDPVFVLKSFLLYPQENLPLLMVGWTLVHEMFFYLVFSVFLLLPARALPWLLIGWAVLTELAHRTLPYTTPEFFIASHPLTLEFISGALLALVYQRLRVPLPGLLVVAGLVAMPLVWLGWAAGHVDPLPVGEDRVLYFLPPSLLLVLGCLGLERQGRVLPDWLVRMGDASYSIYLTHVLILSAACKLWQYHALPGSPLDNLLFIPSVTLLAIGGGVLCYRLVEKPLLQALRPARDNGSGRG